MDGWTFVAPSLRIYSSSWYALSMFEQHSSAIVEKDRKDAVALAWRMALQKVKGRNMQQYLCSMRNEAAQLFSYKLVGCIICIQRIQRIGQSELVLRPFW